MALTQWKRGRLSKSAFTKKTEENSLASTTESASTTKKPCSKLFYKGRLTVVAP